MLKHPTIKEVADLVGRTVMTIRGHIRRGNVKPLKKIVAGRMTLFFRPEDIKKLREHLREQY